jgi:hypothetical protein
VKDRTSERRIFFLFSSGLLFFLLHPEGEKTEERGEKKRSILAPLSFLRFGVFSSFYLFFGFARMCHSLAPFILFSSPFNLSPFFSYLLARRETHEDDQSFFLFSSIFSLCVRFERGRLEQQHMTMALVKRGSVCV